MTGAFALRAGEPPAGPWRAIPAADLLAAIPGTSPSGRPRVIAVDGHGAAGKSTLADRLAATAAAAVVVHTDDIAWQESFFGWSEWLGDGVLRPVRAGRSVSFRPPAWERHGRAGAIEVAAGLDLVVVEGVGAARRELADSFDAVVWVQSDFDEAERRGIARDIESGVNGDVAATIAFWHLWMDEELAFFAADRPWERADLVVAGTPPAGLEKGFVAIAAGPLNAA